MDPDLGTSSVPRKISTVTTFLEATLSMYCVAEIMIPAFEWLPPGCQLICLGCRHREGKLPLSPTLDNTERDSIVCCLYCIFHICIFVITCCCLFMHNQNPLQSYFATFYSIWYDLCLCNWHADFSVTNMMTWLNLMCWPVCFWVQLLHLP